MRVAEQAQKGYEHFVEAWRPHAPKEKARGRIPIESVFATVRHRTVRTKGSLSSKTARLMVFQLVMAAARTWRRLKGQNQLPKLIAGARFLDGIETSKRSRRGRLFSLVTQIPAWLQLRPVTAHR